MKSLKKIISAFVVACVLGLALTSCSGYNFYDEFKEAGADITEDHIFEVVNLEKAQANIEADETFVLVYGTSESLACVNVITSLQAQAEYLEAEDKTIYFMDATDYIESSKKRKEVREALDINDPMDALSDSPVIVIYKNGKVDIDTSNPDSSRTKKFLNDSGAVQYASLASYIFREILAE